MTALQTALGDKAIVKTAKTQTPVPAFSYLEVTDFSLIKANLYYAYVSD